MKWQVIGELLGVEGDLMEHSLETNSDVLVFPVMCFWNSLVWHQLNCDPNLMP